jgi:hypothetical protein
MNGASLGEWEESPMKTHKKTIFLCTFAKKKRSTAEYRLKCLNWCTPREAFTDLLKRHLLKLTA